VRRRADRQLLVDADAPIYTSKTHRLAWRSAVLKTRERKQMAALGISCALGGPSPELHTAHPRGKTALVSFLRNMYPSLLCVGTPNSPMKMGKMGWPGNRHPEMEARWPRTGTLLVLPAPVRCSYMIKSDQVVYCTYVELL
jgi:hypothetical protein